MKALNDTKKRKLIIATVIVSAIITMCGYSFYAMTTTKNGYTLNSTGGINADTNSTWGTVFSYEQDGDTKFQFDTSDIYNLQVQIDELNAKIAQYGYQ